MHQLLNIIIDFFSVHELHFLPNQRCQVFWIVLNTLDLHFCLELVWHYVCSWNLVHSFSYFHERFLFSRVRCFYVVFGTFKRIVIVFPWLKISTARFVHDRVFVFLSEHRKYFWFSHQFKVVATQIFVISNFLPLIVPVGPDLSQFFMHGLDVLPRICIPLDDFLLHNSFFSNGSVGKKTSSICSFGPDLLGIRKHNYFGIGFWLLLGILRSRWADEAFMGTIFFVVFSCFFESIDIITHWINLYNIGSKKYFSLFIIILY